MKLPPPPCAVLLVNIYICVYVYMHFFLNLYIQVLDHTSSQLNPHQAAKVVWKKRADALVNSNNASKLCFVWRAPIKMGLQHEDATKKSRPRYFLYIYMCVCVFLYMLINISMYINIHKLYLYVIIYIYVYIYIYILVISFSSKNGCCSKRPTVAVDFIWMKEKGPKSPRNQYSLPRQ